MSNGRGGGGSAKNINAGGGGGSDLFSAGVARLETEIKELKSKIEADSKEVGEKIGNVRVKLATITGKLEQINRIWWAIGISITLGTAGISGAYVYTNKVSEDVRRLEVSIASSRPQQPPNAR
jgi:hypothetical protein